MVRTKPATHGTRIILVTLALLLPTLSLLPFGAMYLWQQGWMLWWALGALGIVGAVTLLQRVLLSTPVHTHRAAVAVDDAVTHDPAGVPLSPAEQDAWVDVRRIADTIVVDELTSVQALVDLGQRTVDAVARRLHAEKHDAMWQFTLPEAFAISEQVSRRLGAFVDDSIPFGDRLTVAQVLSVYRWRSVVGVAERAYDIWRVVRLANPAAAATAEARERMSKAMLQWGQEHVARRFAAAFVEEVGRAAIDLYSGRLKSGMEAIDANANATERDASAPRDIAAPRLSLAVVGSAADRDTIAVVLERTLAVRLLADPALPAFEVEVSSAISAKDVARRQLVRVIAAADIVVWVVDSETVSNPGDLAAHAAVKQHYISSARLLAPAVVLARLARGKRSKRAELADPLSVPLGTGAKPAVIVDVITDPELSTADIAALADTVVRSIPEARHVRAIRDRATGKRHAGIFAAGGKAIAAAGSLAGAVIGGSRRDTPPRS